MAKKRPAAKAKSVKSPLRAARTWHLCKRIRTHGVPVSGTSGTGHGHVPQGSVCINMLTLDEYVNTGTNASPTWTPKTHY
jgi:hypothetical protein